MEPHGICERVVGVRVSVGWLGERLVAECYALKGPGLTIRRQRLTKGCISWSFLQPFPVLSEVAGRRTDGRFLARWEMKRVPDRNLYSDPRPVAIGGIGGSGTRVFAALLTAAGAYMGPCLNEALDNLWFTVLFKRPEWGQQPAFGPPAPHEIAASVRLFHRAMVHGLADWGDTADKRLLRKLRDGLPPCGAWKCGAQAEHADSLIASKPPAEGALRFWGWKEPNTHIFLPHIDRHIPGLRYIHIVRNGLDMAFSQNSWQARHWGQLYGMPYRPDVPSPVQKLRYWSAANERAIVYGKANMRGRFLTVQYEDFCRQPQEHWHRIKHFLGLPNEQPLPAGLVSPSTIGRSALLDLSGIPQADLENAKVVQQMVDSEGVPVRLNA